MNIVRLFTVFVICALATVSVQAENLQQCKKVVIAGDAQWPPYTIISATGVQGIGMDLAQQIFDELDIEVELKTYADLAQMQQELRNGTIDIIVSTYDYNDLDIDAEVIQPAYIADPITIAAPAAISNSVTNWNNLVGLNGVASANFRPDDKSQGVFSSYLDISTTGTFIDDLLAVQNGAYKYILGSELQLSYAIKNHNIAKDLVIVKNLNNVNGVHMAFANNSSCKLYDIYVQKRLQDYKNNGTVEKIMRQYIY